MKALLLALMLTVSTPLFAAGAPPPVPSEVVGVIGFSVDGKIRGLIFVFSNGGICEEDPADCVAAPACKAEVEHLIAIKHMTMVEVSIDTKV